MRIRPLLLVAVLVSGCGGPGQETAPSVPPLVSVPTIPSETPSETPSTPPTSKVAETLCVRMDQTLVQTAFDAAVVQIQPKSPPAEFGIPVTYDVCELGLSTSLNGPVLRVGVSLQEATKQTLAAAQKAATGERVNPAVVAEGKPGTGAPGFVNSTSVVFLLDGHLYKLSGPKATLTKYLVLADDVVQQAKGLPAPVPAIARPACERGSSAAAKVLGAPVLFRRDGESDLEDVVCGWVGANSVVSTSVRRTPKAVELMNTLRKSPTSQPIPLGEEGYVDTATGRTTIRMGPEKLVDLVPLPARAVNPDTMTQFALAMISVYR